MEEKPATTKTAFALPLNQIQPKTHIPGTNPGKVSKHSKQAVTNIISK